MESKRTKQLTIIELAISFLWNIVLLFTVYTSIQRAVAINELFQTIYPSYLIYLQGMIAIALCGLSFFILRSNVLIESITKLKKINFFISMISVILSIGLIVFYLLNSQIVLVDPYLFELFLLGLLISISITMFIIIILTILLNYQIKQR